MDLHPDTPLNIEEGRAPRIEFRNVTFSYRPKPGEAPKAPIFQDLSFIVQPGQKVAFVGVSQAGKTTILNLLYRYYQPTEGSIFINGQDISQVGLSSLRKNMSLFGQNANLFNDTVRENIRYGAEHSNEVTDEMIWRLAESANLTGFLDSLKDGEKIPNSN